jgi:hypothetical protein
MDTYNWDANFNPLPPTGGNTTQTYRLQSPSNSCYDRTIHATTQTLVSVHDGPGCD